LSHVSRGLAAPVLESASRLARFGGVLKPELRGQMAVTLSRPTIEGLRRGIGAAMLAGLLAGCSMLGGSDSGSAPAPSTGQTATSASDAGAAPAKSATTSTPAAQQPVASGLVADQQNTAYSNQPLTALSEQANAPPPQQVTTLTPPTTSMASTTEQPAEVPAAAAPAESSATTASVQAPAVQPPAVPPPVQLQLATAPQPTTGITPLAPPPNPLPPATQTASAMPETTGSVSVDQSQLGGAAPQEQLYPAPYAPMYGAQPAGSVATGTTYVAQPASLPPPGAPIAVVFFADASSSLSDRAMGVLRNVILVQRQVGGQLRIIGHASERTAAVSYSEHISINQRLSQARANAVARALIRFGAAPGSISMAAVGSQQPVYLEVMPTGEAGNRRVEVYLDGPSASVAAASPAFVQPVAPGQPVTVANGSVTVDLSALDQPAVAGGYYAGGQAASYGQAAPPQLADTGYAPPAVLSSGGLLYPPTQSPVSMLTVPPPPGSEPYVAEQPQAPATATGAATPPSNATATAETSTPTVPPDSTGTASNAAATASEQTSTAGSTGGSTDSTQTGSAPATTASGTDTSASAGTGTATGAVTQQAAAGAAADTGAAATAASTGTATSTGTQQAATGATASTGSAATTASAGTGTATSTDTQQATTGATAGTGSAATAASGGGMTTASAGGTQPAAAATLVDGQLRIAFPKDSAEIPDAAKSELDNLAQKMTADATIRIELTAYASGTPDTATQARRLSLLRALAVRSYLIRQGVSSMRMDVRALGDKVQGEPSDRVDLVPNSS